MVDYVSTRGGSPEATFDDVLLRGLAPDGGLYVPSTWPRLTPEELGSYAALPYREVARRTLKAFAGASLPDAALEAAAAKVETSFRHKAVAPLVELEPDLWLLELFHGPTAAFKDLAMQMMAPLLDAALEARGERLLLLTATSGDTGAAAVRAFAGAERVQLAVFHPQGRVSPVQRCQMTAVDAPNVLNLAVRGDFDDCQRLVKALLADRALRERRPVSSVNSINWGRLVGQIPYYLTAGAALGAPARPSRFVTPTGNLGDAFSGWAAKRMGLAGGRITLALNANDALARALETGRYRRAPAKPTASVSMDVQAPSNFERLVFECSGRDPAVTRGFFETFARDGTVDIAPDLLAALRREVWAVSVDDAATAAEVRRAWNDYGRVVCPHTAVALSAARRLDLSEGPVVVLATAHASKFPEFVTAVLGFAPEPCPQVRDIADHPERLELIDADLRAAEAAVGRLLTR